MFYQKVEFEDAPQLIKDWVENFKDKEGFMIVTINKKTYLIVTRGEKYTGGYDIEVSSVKEDDDDKFIVKFNYKNPDEEQIVAQVITYPFIIIEFPVNHKLVQVAL